MASERFLADLTSYCIHVVSRVSMDTEALKLEDLFTSSPSLETVRSPTTALGPSSLSTDNSTAHND